MFPHKSGFTRCYCKDFNGVDTNESIQYFLVKKQHGTMSKGPSHTNEDATLSLASIQQWHCNNIIVGEGHWGGLISASDDAVVGIWRRTINECYHTTLLRRCRQCWIGARNSENSPLIVLSDKKRPLWKRRVTVPNYYIPCFLQSYLNASGRIQSHSIQNDRSRCKALGQKL